MEEVLLEGGGDGGFARGGEASEPDGEALLLAEGLALGAREGGVPGDVARGTEKLLVFECCVEDTKLHLTRC